MVSLKDFVKEDKKTSNWNKLQLNLYETNGAPEEILYFIKQPNGKGHACERFARKKFNGLNKRNGSGHDHVFHGKKAEQKTSGLWNGKDFKWQHIEEKHDWDFLILSAIDFNEIRWYYLSKKKFNELRKQTKSPIHLQGKKGKSKEGYWFTYSEMEKHLQSFKNASQLKKLVDKL